MPTQWPIPTLVEAAKVARAVVSGLGQQVPFLLSSLAVCIFLFLVPRSIVPAWFGGWRWCFAAMGVFLSFYFALLWWFANRPHRQARWHLKHLGADEVEILVGYLYENKTVRYFPTFHGPACSLIARGILVYPSGSAPFPDAPFAIVHFVLVYLRKHPEILGLKPDQIGSEKLTDERFPEATYAPDNNT